MDFGIARAVADTSATMTQTAAVIGTAQYLSPEQARGETVDARSDIYSAGCLLYELLTGRPPFTGESPVSVAYQHVREQPRPPSDHDEMITPEIDAITLKALAKDPADRFQSAREMRDEINRLLAGERVTTVIPTPTPPPPPTVVVPTVSAPASADETTERPLAPSYEDALITTSEEDDDPPKRSPAAIALLVLLLVVALAAVAFVVFWFMNPTKPTPDPSSTPSSSATVELRLVPDVTGLDQQDAETLIRNVGLIPDVQPEQGKDDDTVGKVTEQDPKDGTQLPVDSKVTLTVNVGPKQGTVPLNLIGKSRSDVDKALKSAGFTKITYEPSANEPVSAVKDQVLDISPGEGTSASVGTKITVVYATGEVEVPNWDGDTRSQVESDAASKDLKVTFTETERDDVPAGTVVDQNPGAGETVKKGSTVKVTLAKAPSAPPSSPDPPSSPPASSPAASGSPTGQPT